jgi:alanine-glyoxylate transaminase/serine-glyoxylate transaminase/serine-pyruvate transaminase
MVYSVGEELNQDEWELDVVLTASQKSNWCTARIGTLMVSEKAMQVWENRKTPA